MMEVIEVMGLGDGRARRRQRADRWVDGDLADGWGGWMGVRVCMYVLHVCMILRMMMMAGGGRGGRLRFDGWV